MSASSVPTGPPTADPDVRRRLLEAAARLLGDDGPAALSTRRLATEAGTSTMAVYTHFGGMPNLVREVVAEAFARLGAHLNSVAITDDPLDDLRLLAAAYRRNAIDNPDLYKVMFGSASLGGYRLTGDEMSVGTYTFDILVAANQRVIDAGAFRPAEARIVAAQFWSALHGFVMLELAGHHAQVDDPVAEIMWPMLINLAVGLGVQ